MPPPKSVIFDLGNVLLDFDYKVAARKFIAASALDQEGLHRLLNQSPLLLDYEAGRTDTKQFFRLFCAASSYRGSLDEFAAIFGDIFTPVPRMIELHEELRAGGMPTAIFSNTNELAMRHVRARYPFFARFSSYFLSYEHGMIKPNPQFCELIEKELRLEGPELLYIDDRQENVEVAQARHWQVIHHTSPATTLADPRLQTLLPQQA